MLRIDNSEDWDALHARAKAKNLTVTYRKARCQHGKTNSDTCRDCEGGYVDDIHKFAKAPARFTAYALSDDHEDVAFINEFVVVVW